MIFLKIAAFWLPVIGIGGIVGAIETGTSPVKAIVVFLIGCLVMAVYARLDSVRYRRDKEIDCFIRKENRFCHRPKLQNLKDN